jgi:hypothetical protein
MKHILILGRRHNDPEFALSEALAKELQVLLPDEFTATGAFASQKAALLADVLVKLVQ